jgi:hypothetical protein
MQMYKKVIFDAIWLEAFLMTELEITSEQLLSKSEFARDKRKRSVIFYALYRYAYYSYDKIAGRYMSYGDEVKRMIAVTITRDWPEKTQILELLKPYMPTSQYDEMKYDVKTNAIKTVPRRRQHEDLY